MADGILVVNKPVGPTSFQVVSRIRRLYATRRVGHAGTLDPFATGILVLGLGRGTAVLRYMEDFDKRYRARLRIGRATTTQDPEGETNCLKSPDAPRRAALLADDGALVRAALRAATGAVMQQPPMYSAIKLDGQTLYQYARRGEMPPAEKLAAKRREVTVHSAQLIELRETDCADEPLEALVDYHVSKGTYIRTLVDQLGRDLDSAAYCLELERLAVGHFTCAHSLDAVQAAVEAGEGEALLLPLEAALQQLPVLELSDADGWRIAHGQAVSLPDRGGLRDVDQPGPALTGSVRLHDTRGFIGIGRIDREAHTQPIVTAERILAARD